MPGTERLKAALSDRYHIERELGAGGMATVYLARDLKHDREVALKVLRSDLSAVIGTERFLSEVRITAKLDHPHILTLIDSGEAEGILYYVLPYVRGESLRGKLNREKQLGVEEALSIVRQVGSALDYAHERGVVHRDIKPENILLHEGEAVLADFGIALAVKEAGGNRLTETGLSLGTPQYMSPEQATGDRALDKRSDIYSLGAVFYEMIAGEPPVTGATAQAMIAKLLTERPVRLRVVRPTITLEMESAAEKALAKVPADRFTSAGDFVRALSATATRTETSPMSGKMKWIAGGVAAAAVIAVGLWMAGKGSADSSRVPVSLRDRTQLTNTGNVNIPVISPDGKSIAYVVSDCGSSGCRYSIEMMDMGGASRRLLEGASGVYGLEISPDRRNVLAFASISGVFGTYMISTLGGPPRLVANGQGIFASGGDSLLLVRSSPPSKTFWILVSGLDGNPVDSIRVDGPADRIAGLGIVPGSKWIMYALATDETIRWYTSDRTGERHSTLEFASAEIVTGAVSADALWLTVARVRSDAKVFVRHPIDIGTGAISQRGDTVHSGGSTNMSVTADGTAVLLGEGTTEWSGWSMSFDDVIKGRFTDDKRVLRSTTRYRFSLASDGSYLTLGLPGGNDFNWRWSVMAFPKGTQVPLPGRHSTVWLRDSTTASLVDITDSGTEFSTMNIRTRQRGPALKISAKGFIDDTILGTDTWAWIPPSGNTIRVQSIGEKSHREFKVPSWYKNIYWVSGSASGDSIAFIGWKAPGEDSVGIGVLSIRDGKFKNVWTTYGEGGATRWLDDGSLMIMIYDTPETGSFYRSRFDGKVERLGNTTRPIYAVTTSDDLKRAFALTRDFRGDAWLSRVVR